MLRRWHIALFLLALLVSAAALAPAALLARAAGDLVALEDVSGTVWRGGARRFAAAGFEGRDARWTVDAGALGLGRLRLHLESGGGDATGAMALTQGLGGVRGFETQTLTLTDAPLFPGLALLEGETRLSRVQVRFAGGRCAAAAGEVRSDVLTRNKALLGWTGPMLNGGPVCEGEDLRLTLTGAEGPERIALEWRVGADGAGAWRGEVQSARPETEIALRALGFAQDPADGAYRVEREIVWPAQ